MKNLLLISASALAVAALAFTAGCDDDTDGTGGASSSTTGASMTTTGSTMTTTGSNMTSTSSGMTPPPPPALGAQIDRFGRPAINTALNHTFDLDNTAKGMAKDQWNGNGTLSNWVTTFSPEVQKNLAIIDSLDSDGTTDKCGNQLGAAPPPAAPGRYKFLADVLSMDRLWVNTAATSSNVYLAVEANALMIVPNMDGGGRSLPMDVIDISYSVLAAGALMGIGDGIGPDADTQGQDFPYLANPH